jgi:hypothetical protein
MDIITITQMRAKIDKMVQEASSHSGVRAVQPAECAEACSGKYTDSTISDVNFRITKHICFNL